MNKVLEQAEILAEAILSSDEYIAMRMAEEKAMNDEKATMLIAAYTEKRQAVENLLADSQMDHGALAAAGEELRNVENAIDENEVLHQMRHANEHFSEMMNQVNAIIRRIVTGEEEECTGSCSTCGGCH